MIKTNTLLSYIAKGKDYQLDALYTNGSIEIIEKLGYDVVIYEILQELFKEPVYIYTFLEECEKSNIKFDDVLEYLNVPRDNEWDYVKKLDIKLPQKFDDFSLNLKEYHKANELMKLIKKGEFDYYEKAAYRSLEPETQKFVVFLMKIEISSTTIYTNTRCRIIDRHLVEYDKERKRSAVNCWKFLRIIKEV